MYVAALVKPLLPILAVRETSLHAFSPQLYLKAELQV